MQNENKFILDIFRSYAKINKSEDIRGKALKLLKTKISPISRKNSFGHITASAILVNKSLSKVLLIHHKNLNKLIQPGGHIDEEDTTLYEAASRELREETGLTDFTYLAFDDKNLELPLDIDIHRIPANEKKNEPEHWHFDFRYLFCLVEKDKKKINTLEVDAAQWESFDDLVKNDPSFSRVVAKLKGFILKNTDKIFFDGILKRFNLENQQKTNIILVSHIVPDILNFISALESVTKSLSIIAKPNSINKEVLSKLKSKNIVTVSKQQLRNKKIIKDLLPTNGKTYIIDIGGYFANDAVIECNKSTHKIVGVVEDTENGLQKYMRLNGKINFPVISVARSVLKENEDDLVGYSVAYYTEMVTRLSRRLPRYITSGIIGYGKLGKGIAKYLFSQNIKPLVFDINPVKAIEAYKDGCIPTNKEGILSQSDLLFCATGSKSLNGEDFLKIKAGCYVASVTSSDDEFNLANLKKWFSTKTINKFTTKLENANTYFYLINDGNAVNFLNGDRVGNFIRLVQAEILVALSVLSEEPITVGIHELSHDYRKTIAGFFLNKYLGLE